MILFVFEGKNPETPIFKTLEYLYFPNKLDSIICCFKQNIYELYRRMKSDDGGFEEDIISVIRDKLGNSNDNPLRGFDNDAFSEVYLFFDYDFQNSQLPLDELNKRVNELLEFFTNDSENTRLYISYPMVESIRCTNELPDANFLYYEISRKECHEFKDYASQYKEKSLDFIAFRLHENTVNIADVEKRLDTVKENWKHLNRQHIEKANYICTGNRGLPKGKDDVRQASIFENQVEKYVKPKDSVAILNAFPLFLYEYFR